MTPRDRIAEFIATRTGTGLPDLIASQEYDGGMGAEFAVLNRSDLAVVLMQLDDANQQIRDVMRESRQERAEYVRQPMRFWEEEVR